MEVYIIGDDNGEIIKMVRKMSEQTGISHHIIACKVNMLISDSSRSYHSLRDVMRELDLRNLKRSRLIKTFKNKQSYRDIEFNNRNAKRYRK